MLERLPQLRTRLKFEHRLRTTRFPIPPIICFFLKMRETSEGTSSYMVRLVFRHLAADEPFARQHRHEPSPEFPLTLPFSGIFRGFSACYSYSNHSQDHGRWHVQMSVCACVCVCVRVWVWKNTENHWKKREMRVVWCVLCGVVR